MTDLDPSHAVQHRWRLAVALLLTANFTLAVDFSILNVALPHMGTELGFSTGSLQWIVTVFALCAAGFTLFFGRVSDVYGRKRLFIYGIALLGIASLAGGLAETPAVLLVARAGQGLATAIVTPAALSLMTSMFAEGPARSRILGLNGALMAAGFTMGAVMGGLLTGTVSWRWAFFINVIVAALVLMLAPKVLHERPASRRPHLDGFGAVFVTIALVALVFGIDAAGHRGWTHVTAWAPLIGAAGAGVVFWLIENHVDEPLVSPQLLKLPQVAWGNVAGLIAFATETSLVFLLTLYLQEILGFSAVTAGLILAVLGLGTVAGGLMAPRFLRTHSPRTVIALGFAAQAAATAPLAWVGTDSRWVIVVLVTTLLGGVANLVVIVGFTVAATTGVPDHQQGLATGLVTMSQQIGIALGTPVMSAIVTASAGITLLAGLHRAIGVNAAICLMAAAVVGFGLRRTPVG